MAATILLVDDSPTILKMLELGLRQAGYQVITAQDGIDGLEKLKNQPVDLIVSDVNMPRMDGISFIAQVRQQPENSHLPIIVLSTEAQVRDRNMGMKAGADLYLSKPVSQKDLVASIKDLLSQGNGA
ncbi:MAG: response regulator [Desulfarculaceae bacterium]|jgi:two-component system chemotaxis response regulator CheY